MSSGLRFGHLQSAATVMACLCTLVMSEAGLHAQEPKPLTKRELIDLTTDPRIKEMLPDFITRVLKRNGIGFLPTTAVQQELRDAGVPPEISSHLIWLSPPNVVLAVTAFECRQCPPEAGEGLASRILEAVFDRKEPFYAEFDAFFSRKTIDPRLGPAGGYTENPSPHPRIFLSGVVEPSPEVDQVTARLSYIDGGTTGAKSLAHLSWTLPKTGDTGQYAKEIAAWYVAALSASVGADLPTSPLPDPPTRQLGARE